MRLKSTPCEGAAVDQGIKRSPEPLVTWALVATGNRGEGTQGGNCYPATRLPGFRKQRATPSDSSVSLQNGQNPA